MSDTTTKSPLDDLTDEERAVLAEARRILARLGGKAANAERDERGKIISKRRPAEHYSSISLQRKEKKGWPKGVPRGPRKKSSPET